MNTLYCKYVIHGIKKMQKSLDHYPTLEELWPHAYMFLSAQSAIEFGEKLCKVFFNSLVTFPCFDIVIGLFLKCNNIFAHPNVQIRCITFLYVFDNNQSVLTFMIINLRSMTLIPFLINSLRQILRIS